MVPAQAQMVVAHRGASADAPENTLAAFKLAWQQGADGIEGDFYLTADEQIVCIHDSDTKRTAGRKRDVESATLEELRQLEYGAWKDPAFAGEPIPTLDEVIATVPEGKTMVIELKSKQKIVPKLVETLKRHADLPIQWLVISFDAPTVAEVRKRMPEIRVHWLTSFKRGGVAMSKRPTAAQIGQTVARTGASGVGMKGDTSVIDLAFVQELRRAGCPEFHVWTIDSAGDAVRFADLGAVGITTNVPAMIGPALSQRAE